MQPFESAPAYPVFLSASLPGSHNRHRIHLILRDRALLIANASLSVGRDIGDRFGQTITLELMLGLFQQAEDSQGFMAALALYRGLLTETGDGNRLHRIEPLWQQLTQELSEEAVEALRSGADDLLAASLASARERFGEGDILELQPKLGG